MAQIDRVYFENSVGQEIYHVNVSDIVGIGGTNERNDVMLVQALFTLLGYTDHFARKYFGMSKNDLPKPTGNRDDKTFRAIWRFQATNATRLLNIDGKIHPASYKNRVIKDQAGRVMAITFINMHAIDSALMYFSPGSDIFSALKEIAPELILKPFDPWA